MNDYRKLAKIFNISFLKKLASEDYDISYFEEIIEFKRIYKYAQNSDFKKLYSEAYKILLKNYKIEYVYKNELFSFLKKKYDIISKDGLITELRTGKNRADIVFLNGTSIVYEIKTEYDKNDRLLDQIDSYSKLFKEVYVVTFKNNIDKVRAIIPKRVGIIEFVDKTFLVEREAEPFVDNLSHIEMFKTLRKHEYKSIIEKYYNQKLSVKDDQIYNHCLKLFYQVPVLEAHELVISELKNRSSNDLLSSSKILPKSILFLIENSNMKKNDIANLKKIFS